jgi:hypothetical protein
MPTHSEHDSWQRSTLAVDDQATQFVKTQDGPSDEGTIRVFAHNDEPSMSLGNSKAVIQNSSQQQHSAALTVHVISSSSNLFLGGRHHQTPRDRGERKHPQIRTLPLYPFDSPYSEGIDPVPTIAIDLLESGRLLCGDGVRRRGGIEVCVFARQWTANAFVARRHGK